MQKHLSAAGLVLALLLSACSNTHLVSSWKAPDASLVKYDKILVVALTGDKYPSIRHNVENAMAQALQAKGIKATAAFSVYGDVDFKESDEKSLTEKIKNDGYDGAFLIVLLDRNKEHYYNPGYIAYTPYGVYYRHFWGSYFTVYSRIYQPGYYTTTTDYLLEASFYNLTSDQVEYTAQAKTFDPGSPENLAAGFSSTVVGDMEKQGVLQ